VHLVTPPATRHAFFLIASDDRLVFVLPWLGSSLVGTTDTDYAGDPSDAGATDEDVAYLVSCGREAFPQASFDDVAYTFAGIRALERVEDVSEGVVPREHEIRDHTAKDGVGGIVSVVGGKLTAYRGIAPSSAATRVEVVHAVEEECAATLSDVLLRRTCLGLARDRALPLARAAAETLGWGTGEAAAYADEVRGHAPARERARSGYGGGR
jgi:glycerol-3-phosphate dehydrogenase